MGEVAQRVVATSHALLRSENAFLWAKAMSSAHRELDGLWNTALAPRGPTFSRYRLLRVLEAAADVLNIADLASVLRLHRTTVRDLVDALSGQALVDADRDIKDRRRTLLALSLPGRLLLRRTSGHLAIHRFGDLSDASRHVITSCNARTQAG